MSEDNKKRQREEEEAVVAESEPAAKVAKKATQVFVIDVHLHDFPDVKRSFDAPLSSSFEDLATALLDSVNYPTGEIYSFHLDDKPFGKDPDAIFAKTVGKAPSVDIVNLAQKLKKGKAFTLTYDYGDPTNFRLKVSETKEVEEEQKDVRLVKKEGDAPAREIPEFPDEEFEDVDDDDEDDEGAVFGEEDDDDQEYGDEEDQDDDDDQDDDEDD